MLHRRRAAGLLAAFHGLPNHVTPNDIMEHDIMADDATILGLRIQAFIAAHARTNGDYDPEFDTPEERFNGPDSALLSHAGACLVAGRPYDPVWSSFGSGCYNSWLDEAIREEHDVLVKAANSHPLCSSAGPAIPVP